MTRTSVGGLAAGTFVLGLLAGLVAPGTFARTDHDRLMTDHLAAMGAIMGGSMGWMGSMMDMDSMMGGVAMPMSPAGSVAPADHNAHHAWCGTAR